MRLAAASSSLLTNPCRPSFASSCIRSVLMISSTRASAALASMRDMSSSPSWLMHQAGRQAASIFARNRFGHDARIPVRCDKSPAGVAASVGGAHQRQFQRKCGQELGYQSINSDKALILFDMAAKGDP
jgi:hypothetical protein